MSSKSNHVNPSSSRDDSVTSPSLSFFETNPSHAWGPLLQVKVKLQVLVEQSESCLQFFGTSPSLVSSHVGSVSPKSFATSFSLKWLQTKVHFQAVQVSNSSRPSLIQVSSFETSPIMSLEVHKVSSHGGQFLSQIKLSKSKNSWELGDMSTSQVLWDMSKSCLGPSEVKHKVRWNRSKSSLK